MKRLAFGAVWLVATVILAACGGGDEEPGAPGGGVRTVEIAMLDDLSFEPDTLDVQVGETIRFVLTNEGQIVHDFSPGRVGHDMGHMGQAVVLDPGQTGELTYTFDRAGTVEFGCHQPGHLEAGMVFTVAVS